MANVDELAKFHYDHVYTWGLKHDGQMGIDDMIGQYELYDMNSNFAGLDKIVSDGKLNNIEVVERLIRSFGGVGDWKTGEIVDIANRLYYDIRMAQNNESISCEISDDTFIERYLKKHLIRIKPLQQFDGYEGSEQQLDDLKNVELLNEMENYCVEQIKLESMTVSTKNEIDCN